MRKINKLIQTFVITSIVTSSSILTCNVNTQAKPSAKVIMEAGERISNLIRRNADNIPVPRRFRVNHRHISFVYEYLVKDENGQQYFVCQAQYSDGSYSEFYYCEQ